MSASVNKRNKLHIHLFIVGAVAVLLILLISSLQAKSNNVPPGLVEPKREGCIISLDRPCYDRTVPSGKVNFGARAGEQLYNKCIKAQTFPASDSYYWIETEYCSDFNSRYQELVQYCEEGKNQYISKFTGDCRIRQLGGLGDSCSWAFDCQPEYFCNLAGQQCDDPAKYGYGSGGYGKTTACRSNSDCLNTEYCEIWAGFCARGGCRSDSDCAAQGLTNYYCDIFGDGLRDHICRLNTTSS